MYQHVLVACDLTTKSSSALLTAAALGRAFAPAITIVHVVSMPPVLERWKSRVFRTDLDTYQDLLERQLAAAAAALARQVSAAGITSRGGVETFVRAGDPPSTLAEIAASQDVDLVVVARGRGGEIGSVAERLVRLVGRSVLVTPARGSARGAARIKTLPIRAARRRRAA